MQYTGGADGGTASADVEVGPRTERWKNEQWHKETAVFWITGADTEYEGEYNSQAIHLQMKELFESARYNNNNDFIIFILYIWGSGALVIKVEVDLGPEGLNLQTI